MLLPNSAPSTVRIEFVVCCAMSKISRRVCRPSHVDNYPHLNCSFSALDDIAVRRQRSKKINTGWQRSFRLALYEFGSFVLDTPKRAPDAARRAAWPSRARPWTCCACWSRPRAGWSIARPSTRSCGPKWWSRTATSPSIFGAAQGAGQRLHRDRVPGTAIGSTLPVRAVNGQASPELLQVQQRGALSAEPGRAGAGAEGARPVRAGAGARRQRCRGAGRDLPRPICCCRRRRSAGRCRSKRPCSSRPMQRGARSPSMAAEGEAYAVLGRLKMTYDWDWRAPRPIWHGP